jgi:hypothetical protein
MKANHRIIKLLPTFLTCSAACAAMIMVGCAMQPGTGEPSSQGEALNANAPTTVEETDALQKASVEKKASAQRASVQRSLERAFAQPSTLREKGPVALEQALMDGVDPGTSSDPGDGTEPVPNPWSPHASTSIPVQH